jgi:hypothetical protein
MPHTIDNNEKEPCYARILSFKKSDHRECPFNHIRFKVEFDGDGFDMLSNKIDKDTWLLFDKDFPRFHYIKQPYAIPYEYA